MRIRIRLSMARAMIHIEWIVIIGTMRRPYIAYTISLFLLWGLEAFEKLQISLIAAHYRRDLFKHHADNRRLGSTKGC